MMGVPKIYTYTQNCRDVTGFATFANAIKHQVPTYIRRKGSKECEK